MGQITGADVGKSWGSQTGAGGRDRSESRIKRVQTRRFIGSGSAGHRRSYVRGDDNDDNESVEKMNDQKKNSTLKL